MPELIDRLSLIDKLDQGQKKALDAKDFTSFYALVYFKVILQNEPEIHAMNQKEPEMRYGEWIIKPHGSYGQLRAFCSACGKHSGIGGIVSNQRKTFCPNCGAKMNDHIADDSKKVGADK